jgi:flagellar FliJ protein
MRRFQFRLERFLELRRWKEREWELKLAKILGECLLLENRIREIAEETGAIRLAAYTETPAASGGRGPRVDVEGMARRELFVQRLAAERERTQVRLEEKRREMEKVRARYLEVSKERKVLDKLRERREGEYYERQLDDEYRAVDDMNTSAAAVRVKEAASAVE